MIKRLSYKTWAFLLSPILLVVALVALLKAVTPMLAHYNPQVEKFASEVLGRPVHIRALSAGWYHLKPVIKLMDVEVMSPKGRTTVLRVKALEIGVNLWQSVWHWKLVPGIVVADGADITVYHGANGEVHIAGMEDDTTSSSLPDGKYLLSWLLSQDAMAFDHVNVRWIDAHGTVIPFKNLQLRLSNPSETEHEFYARTELSQTVNSKFILEASIEGDADPKTWSGKIHVQADDVLVNQWLLQQTWKNYTLANGEIDTEVWGELKEGTLQSASAKVNITNMTVIRTDKPLTQMIQQADMNLRWQREEEGWTLSADKLQLRTHGTQWPESQFEINHQGNDYHLQLRYVQLNDLLPMVADHPALPETVQTTLATMKPHGVLQHLNIRWNLDSVKALQTQFDHMSWSAMKNIPGVNDISGNIQYLENAEGQLTLNSPQTQIVWPNWFAQPLPPIGVQTTINFIQKDDQWQVSTDDFQLNSQAGTLRSKMAFVISRDSSPKMDVTANFHVTDMAALNAMMPKKIMNPKLVQWGDYALTQKIDMEGQLKIQGSLSDFPYSKSPGDFQAALVIKNSPFPYFPGYPVASNVNAKIIFEKNRMVGDFESGEVEHTPFEHLQVEITDLDTEKEILTIKGKIPGDAKAAANFVRHSPLIQELPSFKNLTVAGPIELEAAIRIPLFPEEPNTVQGKISFHDNPLSLKNWNLDFKKLNGSLAFTEKGIQASKLSMQLWNDPLAVELKTLTDSHQLQTTVSGQLSSQSIQDYLKNPLLSFASGKTLVNGKVLIGLNQDPHYQLQLQTNLEGMSFDLPEMYGKKADEKRSLAITADFKEKGNTHIQVDYQPNVKAALLWSQKEGVTTFEKGDIQLGGEAANLPDSKMLRLAGTVSNFDSDAWVAYLNSKNSNFDFKTIVAMNPTLHINFKKATFSGHTYDNLNLDLKHHEDAWQLDVQQETLAGSIRIRNNASEGITAYMQKVYLPENDKTSGFETVSPTLIPPLNITIQDLRVGKRHLGRTHLVTERNDDRLQIKELSFATDNYSVETNGYWANDHGSQKTVLQGYVTTSNLAGTLQNMDVNSAIDSKQGELTFKLRWPRSPFNVSLATANGKIKLKLRKGRITHLSSATEEKIGMGKLMSILSLQTLPRRISLDFSDLSQSGYSFDDLQGNFVLVKGRATTKDARLDGPVASASMVGSIDMAKKMYDVRLKVSPHITSSLPVVATIAGGPIVGAVTWVADKVLSKEIGNMMVYSYQIDGPWADPTVQSLRMTKNDQDSRVN